MNGQERKELRRKLLKELYDYHFDNNGLAKQLDKYQIEQDIEVNLAYQYLEEKNLISIKLFGGSIYDYRITPFGIDLIEFKK